MTIPEILTALALPPESRVDQRVPKKLLIEHGAPTAADKRQINESIEELHWHAALKPATVGVPEYRDEVREVLELAVLSLVLRPGAKATRLTELVHRAIPYPVLLICSHDDTLTLSLAPKRHAQKEAGKVVLDDAVTSCPLLDHPACSAFVNSLALVALPRTHLHAVYVGWLACFDASAAAQLTGRFAVAAPSTAEARRADLAAHCRLVREIAALRAAAEATTQLRERVDLNLAIQRMEHERQQLQERL